MKKRFLITRPEYDDTTYYLFHWAQKTIDLAEKKNILVFDCKKERVNETNVAGFLSKKNPSFVFFNGHGDDDCITGHKCEILIKKNKNESLLKEKIVYALSCKSAKKLGPASVKAKAKTYIGYDDDFIFVYDPTKIKKPLSDKTAKLFFDPSNELVISILKGNSCLEAEKRSKNMFLDKIKKLLTSETTTEDSSLVRYLWWDMKHQVLQGDAEAVF